MTFRTELKGIAMDTQGIMNVCLSLNWQERRVSENGNVKEQNV